MNHKRMAYSGSCSNADCLAVYTVSPHDESPDEVVEQIAEGPDEWEAFTSCFVCDSSIDWNGNDFLPLTVN